MMQQWEFEVAGGKDKPRPNTARTGRLYRFGPSRPELPV